MRNAFSIAMLILSVFIIIFSDSAFAVNEPGVSITCVKPGSLGRPDELCREQWNFPGDTVFFDVNVIGNPDYVIQKFREDGGGTEGGGYIELFVDGQKVNRIRIDDGNTTYTRVVNVWYPIFNQYLPWVMGSPTKVRFSYIIPAGVGSIGNHAFNARFSGDDFTSPANSAVWTRKVSCDPYFFPPGWRNPPAGSGCP